ncbi:Sodium- and chloride-dependent betaine transporter [Liparis tanakae]|uniref:Sodium-and chloride-dependent betaine transporter n=1 Tax=Liparis tanakae TaxID=230148 RepID=A0A4Z2E579_9TELE|nr:Sodium- and chloride-dependent betaine transporter [Liparis tanakae]
MEVVSTSIIDMFPTVMRRPGRRELLLLLFCLTCFFSQLIMVTEVFNVYFSVVNFWLSSHIWLFRLVPSQLISQLIDARCRQRAWQPQRAVQPRHAGMYVFQLFDYFACSGVSLLFLCVFESLALGWIFGR